MKVSKGKFKKFFLNLLALNNTPREIALGTAIGVFIAILPVYGLHTVLVIIAAILVRPANKIAMLLGTNISLPPTVPFITWAGYEIGKSIIGKELPALSWTFFRHITWQKVLEIYPALFVGSVILGLICSALIYLLTYLIVRAVKARRAS